MTTPAVGRWLRAPVLHFVVLGALLFAGRAVWSTRMASATPEPVARAPVAVSAEEVRRLSGDFARRWGSRPGRRQLEALVEQAIEEEILEREAKRLALDLGDRVVRRRLIQKMRAVADDPALGEEELHRRALELGLDDDVVIRRHLRHKLTLLLERDPAPAAFGDDQLAAALERHRERFALPATVSFTHVFVSVSRPGDPPATRAAAIAAELATGAVEPVAATRHSDPFPLAARMDGRSRQAIARRFGDDFATAVMALEPGRWSAPVPSPFGLHLVWVHEHEPGGLPPVATVREPLARLLAEERRLERGRRGREHLRRRYQVSVEWPPDLAGSAAVDAMTAGAAVDETAVDETAQGGPR